MSSVVSRAKQSRLLRPVFSALAAALVFVGCTPAAPQQKEVVTPSSASSSSSSSSSVEAMMKKDDGDAMMKEEGGAMMKKEEGAPASDAMMKKDPVSSSAAAMPKTISMYKDGTYDVSGAYFSPAGPEKIQVSITLKNDVITAAKVTGDSTSDTSVKFIGQFIAGFNEQVVGKSIDSVSLDVVNGSSLTPMGFMNALKAIKKEAKA